MFILEHPHPAFAPTQKLVTFQILVKFQWKLHINSLAGCWRLTTKTNAKKRLDENKNLLIFQAKPSNSLEVSIPKHPMNMNKDSGTKEKGLNRMPFPSVLMWWNASMILQAGPCPLCLSHLGSFFNWKNQQLLFCCKIWRPNFPDS